MILIGQYDSPFVRRVALAMRFYGLAFEHRPWSTFGDAEKIAPFNPLRRVPTLVLDDGAVLIESGAILDWLDEGAGAERALIARSGVARRDALKIVALATGLAEKAVALLYERVLHEAQSELWKERCRLQIGAVVDALEAARPQGGAFWFGDRIGHADIAVACALRFQAEAHSGLIDPSRAPKVFSGAARCEALPQFKEIAQTLVPPA